MNKLPWFSWDVIGDFAQSNIDMAAKYFVSTNIFKNHGVIIKIGSNEYLHGFVVM